MSRIFASLSTRGFAATLIALALSFTLVGCGSSGSSNNQDSGPSTCDLAGAEAVLTSKCALGGCHDAASKTSGLDLTAGSDLGARLLGGMPTSGSLSCNSNTTHYLTAGSKPATGLLLNKLSTSPACGMIMPYGASTTSGRLSDTQIACLTSWATTVTSP